MGYLTNSGTGFLKDAVTTVSNVKSYLVNKTGYLVDAIRVGIGDFGQRVLDDGGTVEASAEAAASYREITKDIYDQASLVLFPSGYKDNLLYSHKPVDGSGDFTYTRGTDTATRVGADGYIKKERANLLVQSNQFDTTWVSSVTLTSGQSGYDGSNDAWLLTKTASGAKSVYQNITQLGVATMSVYAKAGSTNWMRLTHGGKTAYFDLSGSGAIGATSNGIDQTITSVGNGWFRCTLTANRTIAGGTPIYPYTAEGDSSGSTDSIYIQDAQLEQGLVANPCIETTTAPVYEGLTDNLPRIDYIGGTPSILLEPSRANVWEYSEYLDYSFASVSSVTTTQNTTETLSPEGLYNATKLEGVGSWSLRDFIGGTGTGTWTISCYVKAVNASSNNTFRLSVGGNNYSSNLTATSEWQRFEFTFTNGSQSACGLLRDSSANDASLYIYGMQVEEGSYATSYIPTYNASATRAADSFNTLTYADNFNSLTFYAEVEMKDVVRDDITSAIRFGEQSSNNGSIRIFRSSLLNPKRAVVIARNLSGDNIINYSATEDRVKIKLTYDNVSGEWELFINGNSEATGTSTDFNEFDTLEISGVGGEARIYKMYIKNSI